MANSRFRNSPSRRGRPTASSSGFISPTSPARSTTAACTSRASELGEELAQLETVPIDADTIVVPVPDTAKAAADSMAYQPQRPLAGRADPQPLHRADLHRRAESGRQSAHEVHGTARSAGRQEGDAGRGHDRPFDDDEGTDLAGAGAGPGQAKSTCGSPARRSSPRAFTASTCRPSRNCSRRDS